MSLWLQYPTQRVNTNMDVVMSRSWLLCVGRKILAIARCLWYIVIPRNYAWISSETGDLIPVDIKSRHIFA